MNKCYTEKTIEINLNIKLTQRSDMLSFGSDAVLISAFAASFGKGRGADFGAGSGVISLLLAKKNHITGIEAVERNELLIPLIEKNILQNGIDKVKPVLSDVREYGERGLDFIVSNPPYLPKGSGIENLFSNNNDARRENNGTISDFVSSASKALKQGGQFFCIYRPERLCDLIFAMKSNKIEPKRIINVYHTVQRPPCLVMVGGVKTGKSGVKISRPLVLFNNDGTRTEDSDSMNKNLMLPEDIFKN